MKKMKINEIFYSLQGEGSFNGKAAVFIRFSGCNIKCPFCDTQHQQGIEMTEEEIIKEVIKYPCSLIVLTGGEPTLFVTDTLIDSLHRANKYIAIETNGTRKVNEKIDYITLSPKIEFVENARLKQTNCDELKVVFNGNNNFKKYDYILATKKFIQPCYVEDEAERKKIMQKAVEFILQNPQWQLSLQTQKILNIR